MAQHFAHPVVQLLEPDCAPRFLTDGFREYLTALLTHYGYWVQPRRRRNKGPAPKLRWMPLPGLFYAQVVKTVRRQRLTDSLNNSLWPLSQGQPLSGTGSGAGRELALHCLCARHPTFFDATIPYLLPFFQAGSTVAQEAMMGQVQVTLTNY